MKSLEKIAKNFNLQHRYIAVENLSEKSWFFYDTETGKNCQMPFGSIVIDTLNIFKTADPSNVHHVKHENLYLSEGLDTQALESFWNDLQCAGDQLSFLYDFMADLSNFKKRSPDHEYKETCLGIWYKYRDCILPSLWSSVIDSDYNGESLEGFSKSVEKNICVYFDMIYFKGNICRAFIVPECYSVFRWDMLHVFCGDSPIPHTCKRCGQLYTSNKNTSKYCPDCQENRNDILNENRKNNVCRYLHKRICDKLSSKANCTNVDKNSFIVESNYYWSIVNEKIPKAVPAVYDDSIKTEADYKKWLDSIIGNPYISLKDRYHANE